MQEETKTPEAPEEEDTRYAIIVTIFGGLTALILVAILGVTLFTAWGQIDATEDDAAGAVAMSEGDTERAATENESDVAPNEAAGDEAAANEEATTEEAVGDEPAAEEAVAENDASEDAASGEPSAEVVTALSKATCTGCHVIPGVPAAVGMVGPDLSTIGVDGATRVDGMDAEAYIHESIVDPEAFIAPDCPTGACPPGLMSPAFANMLSDDELNDVVAYLSTLGN